MRRGRVLLAVVVAVAMAACGGPQEPLDVGMKQYGTRVVLGEADVVRAAVPLPPDAVVLPFDGLRGLPLVGPLPPPVSGRLAPPPPASAGCATAPLGAAPVDGALTDVAAPPAEGEYVFRNDGEYSTSGANVVSGRFPAESVRRVHDVVQAAGGSFSFVVTSLVGESTTETSYLVIPRGQTNAGLRITRIVNESAGRRTEFVPQPPLMLLPFPAVPGARYQSAGADAANHTVMAFNGAVRPNARVDACGDMLDAIEVVIDGSVSDCAVRPPVPTPAPVTPPSPPECSVDAVQASGPGSQRFRAVYAIGTQFGGLTLRDEVDATAVELGTTTSQRNTAVISRRPPLAEAG